MLGTAEPDALPHVDPAWRRGWTALAELGVTSFCVPEDQGGFGLHVEAAVATAMEFGAALHGSPFAGFTACIHAVALLGDSETVEVVSAMVAGERIGTVGRLGPDGIARVVDGAREADVLLLLDGSADSMLLVTDRTAFTPHADPPSFDVSRACADLTVDLSGARSIPGASIARDLYGLLLAADALGGVQRMLDRTISYAIQRQAFGRAIGGFQAVQHRLVDHTVRARGMALLIDEAAGTLGSGDVGAHRSVVLAELAVSSGATHILHDLLQLTGAIGFTWEHGLHFYERRAHHSARLAANPRSAGRAIAAMEGWGR